MRRVTEPAVTTARVSPTGPIDVMTSLFSKYFVSSTRRPRERCALACSILSVGLRAETAITPSMPRSSTPCHTAASTPSSTESTTTSASVPKITPMSVKKERRGWPLTSSRLVRIDSPMTMSFPWLRDLAVSGSRGTARPRYSETSLLRSQCLDRIQPRRPDGRIHPEHQSRPRGEDQRVDQRRRRDDGRLLDQRGDGDGEQPPHEQAEEAAEDGDEDRLGQELEEDLRRRRADGLARAHLAPALVERGQLDVHDHDAAHDQRDQPADHEGHVVHLVVRLVALEIGHAREHFEVLHAVVALEHGLDLVGGVLVALGVLHARVHDRDLALRHRLALARHHGGDGDVHL